MVPKTVQVMQAIPYQEMTLRDFFAASAPLPEPAYICEVMGWERDLKYGDESQIGDEQGWQDSIVTRWHELPQKTRFKVTAEHSYLWADYMLAARNK
jgi:hypothetical protein